MKNNGNDTVQITVRVTRELLTFIDARVTERGSFVTRADVVREMLGVARLTLESSGVGAKER